MRIMIIDNDKAWTQSLSLLLSEQGHDVQVFNNPVQACEYICADDRKKNEMPNAIVLDYLMPEMSGFQVLGWIWNQLSDDCRIAFVTGHGEQIKNARLQEMGVSACMEKPVDFDQLLDVLERRVA